MLLYLDDDIIKKLLVRLLRQAGHDVQIPADAGRVGADDPIHLTYAINAQRVFLSYNHSDFKHLHDLIEAAGGHHPGILIVRKDDDRRRDMTPPAIVRALAKLIASGDPIAGQYIVLNYYR
jgi:predicted nuclease of predicted toxin-antitoxin system